jgi:type 1 fimbria pilin
MKQSEQKGIVLSLEELQNVFGGNPTTGLLVGAIGGTAITGVGVAVFGKNRVQEVRINNHIAARNEFLDRQSRNTASMLEEIARIR